jgi:hypothetical protein
MLQDCATIYSMIDVGISRIIGTTINHYKSTISYYEHPTFTYAIVTAVEVMSIMNILTCA